MTSLEKKLIIYDSNCKVCSSLRDLILRITSIPEEKIKAYRDLEKDLRNHVDPEKFRNVMALIDVSGAPTLYGADGVAHIFSSQYRIAALLFRFKPIFLIFNFLYKTQAYNRYVIATPKSEVKCDCFPDRVLTYRLSYIAITVLLSIALTALFGISLKDHFNSLSTLEAAGQMLLMAGTGWVLQIALALIKLGRNALDYIGHLGSIMVVGVLILVPSVLFYFLTGVSTLWIPVFSVIVSSSVMLYLHRVRIKHLGLSRAWTWTWFLLLQASALFWIYVFHLKNIL